MTMQCPGHLKDFQKMQSYGHWEVVAVKIEDKKSYETVPLSNSMPEIVMLCIALNRLFLHIFSYICFKDAERGL